MSGVKCMKSSYCICGASLSVSNIYGISFAMKKSLLLWPILRAPEQTPSLLFLLYYCGHKLKGILFSFKDLHDNTFCNKRSRARNYCLCIVKTKLPINTNMHHGLQAYIITDYTTNSRDSRKVLSSISTVTFKGMQNLGLITTVSATKTVTFGIFH